MVDALAILFKHRNILWATSKSEIHSRYMGTALGLLWIALTPILFLSLYALVYTFILGVRIPNYTHFGYVLLIFSGLIPFLGFTEALSSGTPAVIANKNLIKNTLFPIELIPVKAVLTSSMSMLVGLAVLLIVLWCQGNVHYSQLITPLLLGLQLLFTIGVIWIISAMNVFFRDIGQLIGMINLTLMLVSPIGYTVDMIPKHLMILMYPNPLYYLIMLYRESIIVGTVPWDILAIFSVMSVATFALGYYVFSNLKTVFSDYV